MDPVIANFILMIVAAGVGGVVAVMTGVSTCMMKSRCTTITSPCMSCERQPLDGDNPVYNVTMKDKENFKI